MHLKCIFGHKWNGCKCKRCGETRDDEHAWNACTCRICGKRRDEDHDWDLCKGKCRICGKTCPIEHTWNGCKCALCGITRDEEHSWDGCKCTICGKTRDEGHKWNGCKCTICGKTRDEGHSWDGCICTVCGKTRDEEHSWDGCKCTICGKTRDEGHDWGICQDTCRICGKTRIVEHYWDGCKCAICGKTRDENHLWKDGKCAVCGKKQDRLSMLQETVQGKSQDELIAIVEARTLDFDLKAAAVQLINDQAALERIAVLFLDTKGVGDYRKKLDQVHISAIEKLDSGEAVKRAFSQYDLLDGEYYNPLNPVLTCYIKKMQQFYLPNEDVDHNYIATLIYLIAHHVPNSRAWPAKIEELKQCYLRYGLLMAPVWDQLKSRASEYLIYPNLKTYGEGDDAFSISGEAVNIGVDLSAWEKEIES